MNRTHQIVGNILGIVLCLVIGAHGEVPSGARHTNETGAVIEYTNPLMYNMGIIVDADLVRTDKRVATNLRLQPFGTFELYTEQVLLCGQPDDALLDVLLHPPAPVVLAYKKQAHEMVQGVACHEFEAIFPVGAK